MFIEKIVLNNFRIFRGKHEFEFLNKKVIVIEGPNGHGKSTIFDAINWVLSGKISRYVGSSEHQQFNYLINNDAYVAGIDEASVEVFFKGIEEVSIKRTIKRNGTPKLHINNQIFGVREGQNQIIRLLVNDSVTNDANVFDSIDLLPFIESTLILSQENLEEFVRGNKPTERYSKLEQVLGLTRYGQDFRDYLQSLKKDNSMELDTLKTKKEEKDRTRELLDAKYQPKLLQYEKAGSKSKSSIIQDLNNIWIDLNNYKLKSYNNNQGFEELTKNEYEQLNSYNNAVESELKKLGYYKYEIENSEINVNSTEIEAKITKDKEEIRSIENFISKRERGLESAKLRVEKFNMVSNTNNYLLTKKDSKEKLVMETMNISRELEVIANNLQMKISTLSMQELKNFSGKFNSNNKLLENLLLKKDILDSEKILKVLISEAENTKKIYESKNENLINFQNEILVIDGIISKLNNSKEDNLNLQINTIIHEVQGHMLNSNDQKCLVCGNLYQSNEDLKSAIYKQVETSKELINEVEISINKQKVQRNKVLAELNITKEEVKSFQKKNESLSTKIQKLKNKIVTLRLSDSLETEDIEGIIIDIEKCEKFARDNESKNKGYIKIEYGLNKIYNLNLKIADIENEEKQAIRKHERYKYFIGDERNLQLKLNKLNTYIETTKSKKKNCEMKIKEIEKIIQDKERKLQLLEEIKINLEKMFDCKLNLNSNDVLNFINKNIGLLKKKEYSVKNLLSLIDQYLGNIELRQIEENIKEYDLQILNFNMQIGECLNIEEQLKSLVAYHTEVQSSLINQYLKGLSSSINSYFRQISPHSYFSYVDMVTRKNELFILLNDKQTEYDSMEEDIEGSLNASLTLSAAQSTILAMSIFFALNKSQNWSKLNVMGIDDPFQNLDDINAFSFIDVIANLIEVENRQVFLSTHDSDFATLSIRKMNLHPSECAYIKIQSYTKEAIQIQSEQYKLLKS